MGNTPPTIEEAVCVLTDICMRVRGRTLLGQVSTPESVKKLGNCPTKNKQSMGALLCSQKEKVRWGFSQMKNLASKKPRG